MRLQYKYKGRSFSSAKSMIAAMERDAKRNHENAIRHAAQSAGASVSKHGNELKVSGSADQMNRFVKRFAK